MTTTSSTSPTAAIAPTAPSTTSGGADTELLRHLVLDFRQMLQFAEDPWVFTHGEGVRVQDDTGKWYLDGLSGVFVNSLGYGNERVIEAAVAQLRRLHFAPPLHGTSEPAIALTERLRRIAPAGMRGEHGVGIKLLSGGSEATEAALKLARQYHQQSGNPRKYKVIARYGGYHGATMGALSAGGGWERKSVFEPLVAGFLHHHPPGVFRDLLGPDGPVLDDVTCGLASARLVERTIEAEDPRTVAAVIVEPISVSSAGFVVPPAEYHRALRAACDRHDVLLIYDEIITGVGRLGEWFGADYYGVAPDLLCCGKGMGGGYAPLSAVLIADRVWQTFLGGPETRREFHHGHTFGGNPVAAAVGVAALEEMESRNLVARAGVLGETLHTGLESLRAQFPALIADVRGAGLLRGFELDLRQFPPGAEPGKRFEQLARERGLLARCGRDFVVFAPPLVLTDAELDEILQTAGECLAQLQS